MEAVVSGVFEICLRIVATDCGLRRWYCLWGSPRFLLFFGIASFPSVIKKKKKIVNTKRLFVHSNNQQNTNNAACAMLLCICLFWIAILWAASITSLSIASSNPQTTLIQLVVRLMITQSTFTSVMCLWRIWLSSSRVGYSNVYTLFWGFYLSDSPWCIWNSRNPPREKFSMFPLSTSYKYRCRRSDTTTTYAVTT